MALAGRRIRPQAWRPRAHRTLLPYSRPGSSGRSSVDLGARRGPRAEQVAHRSGCRPVALGEAGRGLASASSRVRARPVIGARRSPVPGAPGAHGRGHLVAGPAPGDRARMAVLAVLVGVALPAARLCWRAALPTRALVAGLDRLGLSPRRVVEVAFDSRRRAAEPARDLRVGEPLALTQVPCQRNGTTAFFGALGKGWHDGSRYPAGTTLPMRWTDASGHAARTMRRPCRRRSRARQASCQRDRPAPVMPRGASRAELPRVLDSRPAKKGVRECAGRHSGCRLAELSPNARRTPGWGWPTGASAAASPHADSEAFVGRPVQSAAPGPQARAGRALARTRAARRGCRSEVSAVRGEATAVGAPL
jgi:hypothetical protein